MTDSLKKVHTGDRLRIPAAAYNAFIDTATDAMNRRFDRAGSQGSQSESQTILVRNDSGDDQDRFAVLGVDAPIIAPEDNEAEFTRRVALSCVTPVDARHKGRFVVLAEPLADGKIGRAWASGVCVCKVDIKDASHTTAEIADDETANLESTINGTATILWKAGDTGVQWSCVRIGTAGGSDLEIIKITGATRDGVKFRWRYSARAAKWTGAYSYDDGAPGLSAYNTIEANNGSSGTVSGITLDSQIIGISPIPTGTIIVARRMTDGSNRTLLFTFPNAPIIECL